MGQKVNPILFRLGKTKVDNSTWSDFSNQSSELIYQDLQLRDFLATILKSKGILVRSCSVSRSNREIKLDLDLYFSYIFSKQAKFLWARSLFKSIKEKYPTLYKMKDMRTLFSSLKVFHSLQGSVKKGKPKKKIFKAKKLKGLKRKKPLLLTLTRRGKLVRQSKLLFLFFLNRNTKTKIISEDKKISLSFLRKVKYTRDLSSKSFRYRSQKLSNLFVLKRVPLLYKKISFRASNSFYGSQKDSTTLLDLNKGLCQSVQRFTGLERVVLKLSSSQLLFLPSLQLYRQILLKELLFFQKNKELSKYFFEIIECTFFIFSTFGFGNAALLTCFIKSFLERARNQLLLVKFLKKILSVFSKSLPAKLRACEGIKILLKGRFNKRRRTKTYIIQEGQISLQTINLPLDYFQSQAITVYGSFGIKVWISKRNS